MDKYIKLLETWSGKFEDLSYELYDMLMEETQERRIQCFQFICENVDQANSDESENINRHFEDEEMSNLIELYGDYIDETIKSVRKKVVMQKLSVEDFYLLLWNSVMEESLLTQKKEKVFGLSWILVDDGIPYYKLGTPLSMKNDEYRKIVAENRKSVQKIKNILEFPFKQRTETSSLILKELTGKEYRVQVVLLAQAFAMKSKLEMDGVSRIIESVKKESKED